jgi:hypothetical protein
VVEERNIERTTDNIATRSSDLTIGSYDSYWERFEYDKETLDAFYE